MTHSNVNRNDPCPCGSEKKFKQCCLGSPSTGFDRRARIAAAICVIGLVIAAVLWATVGRDAAFAVGGLCILAGGAWWLFTDPPSSRGSGDPGAISFGG